MSLPLKQRTYLVLNLNDSVRVRLTEAGQKVARGILGECYGTTGSGKNGEWQLWILMQTFGAKLYNGNPDQYLEKNEIEIPLQETSL